MEGSTIYWGAAALDIWGNGRRDGTLSFKGTTIGISQKHKKIFIQGIHFFKFWCRYLLLYTLSDETLHNYVITSLFDVTP